MNKKYYFWSGGFIPPAGTPATDGMKLGRVSVGLELHSCGWGAGRSMPLPLMSLSNTLSEPSPHCTHHSSLLQGAGMQSLLFICRGKGRGSDRGKKHASFQKRLGMCACWSSKAHPEAVSQIKEIPSECGLKFCVHLLLPC